MDTIVALSTPIGKSAIAVIRMSGEQSIEIAKKVFCPFPSEPNYLRVGALKTPSFSDNAMCVYFSQPKSYTGENMVEFHCHGGVALVKGVLDCLLKNGARMAKNGEFSQRAFINGKMNLAQTEGVIEMIDAETLSCVKAGENLLKNQLGKKVVEIQNQLTDLIAQTEVALDYPEEDLEYATKQQTKEQTQKIICELDKLLKTVEQGKVISYGVDVAIVGKTNAGKSSLLNSLLGYDRAIVSNVEGTTRDTLCDSIFFKDVKFNFVDTAGLRKTDDTVESLGIERTQRAIAQADLVLHVLENFEDETVVDTTKKVIRVYNKLDLQKHKTPPQNGIVISAQTGEGVEDLKQAIFNEFACGDIDSSNLILTNQRHVQCIEKAKQSLVEAVEAIKNDTVDCVALYLRDAWNFVGEITGESATEEIIDRIYEKFCLGK